MLYSYKETKALETWTMSWTKCHVWSIGCKTAETSADIYTNVYELNEVLR